jgi:hypothetical protein
MEGKGYDKDFKISTEDYKKSEVKMEKVNLCDGCSRLDEQFKAGYEEGIIVANGNHVENMAQQYKAGYDEAMKKILALRTESGVIYPDMLECLIEKIRQERLKQYGKPPSQPLQ